MNRRSFFKHSLSAAATLILAPLFFRKSAFGANKPPLEPSNPLALSLGYNPDNRKVDTSKWTKKAGAQGKAQKCSNCMFYKSIDAKHGDCQIFPNNTVQANGWCNSWTKKVTA